MPSRARSARARSPGPARAIRTVCNMSEKAGAASETKKSHVVLADVLSDSSIRYIGFTAACIGKLSAVVSALLLSGPCWMLISLCGPHMPNLFVPVLMAGGLRLALVFCNLVQQALEDGVLERWETFGIIARFTCDVFITAHAVFPQPIFNTIVGGSFTSGDAARAAHMRASRWVWRQTVGFPAEYFAAVAVLVYIFARTKQPGLNAIYRAPAWFRGIVASIAMSICWTVFAARMQMLPISFLLGMDPSSVLASVSGRSFCVTCC